MYEHKKLPIKYTYLKLKLNEQHFYDKTEKNQPVNINNNCRSQK